MGIDHLELLAFQKHHFVFWFAEGSFLNHTIVSLVIRISLGCYLQTGIDLSCAK
jgi:hypothetical protein